jgi:phenylacetate-CoA ligase
MLAISLEHVASWSRLRSDPRRVYKYQLGRLQNLIRYASRRVPYYSRRFAQSSLSPGDIQCLDDLRKIPVSDKQDYQDSLIEDRFSSEVSSRDCRLYETSGSTGQRMIVARTPEEDLRLFGQRLRSQVLSGLRPWHRRLLMGPLPRQLANHRLGIFRFSSVDLAIPPSEMLNVAEHRRPHVLKGPPGAFEQILEVVPDRLAALLLKLLFTGGELLSESIRTRLESVSGCPVVDFYGAVECNLIAWQCLHCGRYHTCDDSVIVEVLNDNRPAGPGEEGDVVVTALHSYAMPFIRYRIGDRVRRPKQHPSCSVPFGVIESIQGRSNDYLRFANGVSVSPYQVMDELDEIPEIRRYQVIHERPNRVAVQYETSEAEEPAVSERVQLNLRRVLPSDVIIEPRRVESIQSKPGEKRRFVRALNNHAS